MEEFILSNIDEFDTFESYFGDAQINNDYITIPYINVCLMQEHPLNPTKELLFIDFSYLHIVEPKYVSVYERGIIKNELEEYTPKQSKWYGGTFIGQGSLLDAEIEIHASDVYLIIPRNFKSSSTMWLPDYKQYKGKGNLTEKKVIEFLSKTSNIKKVIVKLE